MKKLTENFTRLKEIITTLRSPEGCPWDRKQNADSFKSYIIEETHELLEAIDKNDPQLIKEELGDMYFQLTFLGELYEEKGLFSVADAINSISDKMVNRHPHVFGDQKVESEEDQRRLWNELKSKEKEGNSKASDLLSNVPTSLPALRRAQRISERAAHNGFEWQSVDGVFDKLFEEIDELKTAIDRNKKAEIQEELGDLLFVLVNIGRLTGTNAEEALISATGKFTKRFSEVERKLAKEGKKIRETSASELLDLWKIVKNELT